MQIIVSYIHTWVFEPKLTRELNQQRDTTECLAKRAQEEGEDEELNNEDDDKHTLASATRVAIADNIFFNNLESSSPFSPVRSERSWWILI